MQKPFTFLIVAFLLISSSLCHKKDDFRPDKVKTLNDTINSILGSVLKTVASHSDSSDSSDSSDEYDRFDNPTVSKPEDAPTSDIDVQGLVQEFFSKNGQFMETLVETVAIAMENAHEHASRFVKSIDNTTNVNDVVNDVVQGDMFRSFGGFNKFVSKIIENVIQQPGTTVVGDEYIVSEGDEKNKPYLHDADDRGTAESSEDYSKEKFAKKKVMKDPFGVISFIKGKLGKYAKKCKEFEGVKGHKGEKKLKRQNAMGPKDFEKLLKGDEKKAEENLKFKLIE